MIRILKFLILGIWEVPKKCEHEYEIIEEATISLYGKCKGKRYISRCKKCGNITEYEFSI